jgi:hypothetical protein
MLCRWGEKKFTWGLHGEASSLCFPISVFFFLIFTGNQKVAQVLTINVTILFPADKRLLWGGRHVQFKEVNVGLERKDGSPTSITDHGPDKRQKEILRYTLCPNNRFSHPASLHPGACSVFSPTISCFSPHPEEYCLTSCSFEKRRGNFSTTKKDIDMGGGKYQHIAVDTHQAG